MKKLLSIVVFAILVLAMGVTAFAVSDDCVITVDGVEYTDFAEGWTAGLRATANNENVVEIVLYADWIADENGSFGEGHGFAKGAVYITENTKDMCFDLNGHTIDRGLFNWKAAHNPIDISKNRKSGEVLNIEDGCDRITIKNGTIKGGCNIDAGGGVFSGDANVVFENIIFTSNYSCNGSGIMTTDGKYEFNSCRFELNNSSYKGGAGFLGGYAIIRNCEFIDNYADFEGGAIYIDSFADGIDVYDSVFKENTARYGGGAINSIEGLKIENTEFSYNTSMDHGGALVFGADANIYITNCSFIGNSSKDSGAIWTFSDLYLTSCRFEGNISTLGGCIRFKEDAVVDDCVFTNNIANGDHPSAIFVSAQGEVTLMNSTITGNTGGNCAVSISTGGGKNLGELWIDGTVIIDDNYNDHDQEVNLLLNEYGFLATSVVMNENFSKDSRIGISMDADDMEDEDAVEDIPDHWTNEELAEVFKLDRWFGNRTANHYYYLCRDGSDIIFKKGDPRDDKNAIVTSEELDAPVFVGDKNDNDGLPENPSDTMIESDENAGEDATGTMMGDGSVTVIVVVTVVVAAGIIMFIRKKKTDK